jgi:hypothetical protein
VVSRCVAELQRLMQAEWRRMDRDVRVDSGIPMSWLRGPSPVIRGAAFRRRWQGLASFATQPPAIAAGVAAMPGGG